MPLPKDLRLGVDVASRRPLRDETYTTLRRAILSGVFAPGDRLVQHDVANRLGLSRSPVREALQRLEQEGLVQSTRQGLVVRGPGPHRGGGALSDSRQPGGLRCPAGCPQLPARAPAPLPGCPRQGGGRPGGQ